MRYDHQWLHRLFFSDALEKRQYLNKATFCNGLANKQLHFRTLRKNTSAIWMQYLSRHKRTVPAG